MASSSERLQGQGHTAIESIALRQRIPAGGEFHETILESPQQLDPAHQEFISAPFLHNAAAALSSGRHCWHTLINPA